MAIEDVEIGDQVTSYDFTQGTTVTKTVCLKDNPVRENVVDLHMSDGNTVASTPDHPYWVKGKGWCSVDPEMTLAHYDIFRDNNVTIKTLQAGDELLVARRTQCLKEGEFRRNEITVTKVTLKSIVEREAEPTSLWILRVGDYDMDWRYAKELFESAEKSGAFDAYHEEMEQMQSRETNPNNHNFFANGVLVHNK